MEGTHRSRIAAFGVVALAVLALVGPGPSGAGDRRIDGATAATRGDGPYCPRGDEDGFAARRLIDKAIRRARRMARRHDCTVRVVKRNGEYLPVTDDFSPTRINVAVRRRHVTGIDGVY